MNPEEQKPASANPQVEQRQWQYSPTTAPQTPADYSATSPAEVSSVKQPADGSSFGWQTIEYIEHQRSSLWFMGLFAGTAVLAGLTYLLTKDYIAVGTIVIVGIIVAIAAGRKPRPIECEVSANGLRIGQKTYNFAQFKSFGIIRESALPSIELFPIKKFVPATVVHFNAQDEQRITSIIGQRLPYEERKMAGIDKLAHSLRF